MYNSPSANPCPYSKHIQGYAACTLDDQQAASLEDHLLGCISCSDALAETVEAGTVPAWLPSLVNVTTVVENYVGDHASSSSAKLISSTSLSLDSLASEGRYQRIRLQGEGGMGQVWQGWDVVMKRRVALKQLRSGNRNAERDRRLLQEATSLARLSHPNIVAVHEVLMMNEQPTLVMEFVDGPPLSVANREFVLSERQAARILERLADAIVHAHEQGVIHRDLKPGNVLLSWPVEVHGKRPKMDSQSFDSAIPKLTDFGLAKTLESDDLTRTGELLGTPAYMAPEQTIGLTSVSHGTDIYGLGAILYDLLTGTPPHVAENPVTTMMLVREREPTAPRLMRPELSKDIETICLKCLQKLPKDRYASASDLRDDLRAYLDGRPIRARPLGLIPTAIRWSRRHKWIVASASLVATLLLALLFVSLWTATRERRLRFEASEARTKAELSERQVSAEAERVNNALDVNREHFEVALDHVNRLALMAYNPLNKTQSELDYNLEIKQATTDIYATYLETLPPPEQWSLKEASAVTSYIKYMTAFGNAEAASPWLDRMKSVVPQFEKAGTDSPKMREFLMQHYYNAHIQAYAKGDYNAAGSYGEQVGRFVDVAPRHVSYILMTTALTFSKAGCHVDAIRVANKSVSVYRTVLNEPDSKPDDSIEFLDQLRWHRYVANLAGNGEEADKFLVEFEDRSAQFDQHSPHYARVQSIIRAFYNHEQ